MTELERGDLIENLIAEITEQCAILFPKNWEYVAKELIANRNLSLTDNEKIQDFMRQLIKLEDESENPYITLLNKM